MRWRYLLIIFIFGASYALLVSRLYNIQLKKKIYYSARAELQYQMSGILEPTRGNIYFTNKDGNPDPAVLNKEYPVISAVPTEIQKEAEKSGLTIRNWAEKLSPIVNLPVEELEKKFSKANDQYELLVEKADSNQAEQIRKLNLKGIYPTYQNFRFYPFGRSASHLLGFISPASEEEILKYGNYQIGRYGVELKFNSILSGKAGYSENGRIIKPENGEDLILTVDRHIQLQAEEILKSLVENWQGEGGTIIVQEPATGKILAMANYPDFDPNNYQKFNLENFLNRAVSGVYELGSVLKVITMAAGLDSGKITPETTYIDKGAVTIGDRTIKNWDDKAFGKINMTNVIEYSVNTGAVFAEQKIGHQIFYDYLNNFGFNELSGIGLPGEVKSNIKNLKTGRDINYATASFGQGISVTSLAAINAFSAVANGGFLMKPLIIAEEKPQVIRRVISPQTAETLTQILTSAVEKNKVAGIANYSIAGKSGTAYIPDFEKGGYTDKVINTFIGFLPVKFSAEKSAFTILIKLDKPTGIPFANSTVAPAFRKLAEFIINYYDIAPDKL